MIALTLTNTAEMVFSASPATEGMHATLGCIPGAAIWGALAARVYADPGCKGRTFELVHSGGVRVSPGFPLSADGVPAFPWPQCLQHPKHEQGRRLWNTLDGVLTEHGERVQTESRKPGNFLDAQWRLARPGRRERGKAAIVAGGRRAEDAQFFQYEMLEAGAAWRAWVDADDPGDLAIVRRLLDGAVLHLGRSKRREFGGEVAVGVEDDWQRNLPSAARHGEVALWCLSDLALPDPHGGIDLAPEPERFAIDGFTGRLDRARSLISTRRYAPYNGFLRARDREHAVIEAGSVLVYRDAILPAHAFAKAVGLWRERGLGIVWAEPSLFADDGKVHTLGDAPPMVSTSGDTAAPADAAPTDHALLAALRLRAGRAAGARQVTEAVETLLDGFRAQHALAVEAGEPTPSASQWARLAEVAGIAAGRVALHEALFGDDGGLCVGATNAEWEKPGGKLRRLIEIPAERPSGLADDRALCQAVQRAAHRMAAEVRKEANR